MPDRAAIGRRARWTALAAAVLLGSGCGGGIGRTVDSVLPGSDDEYRSSRSLPPLEVPPDLSSKTIREGFEVPGQSGSARYSDYVAAGDRPGQRAEPRPRAAPRRSPSSGPVLASRGPRLSRSARPESGPGTVRIERSGKDSWLVADGSREDLWPLLKGFWIENGFEIEVDDPGNGVLETNWVESEIEPPKRGFLGSLASRFGRDKEPTRKRESYAVRVEPGRDGGATEVYVTHRQGQQKDGEWQPVAPDANAESEMLTRLSGAIRAGRRTEGPRLANLDRGAQAHIVDDGRGGRALALRTNFSRAWERTGLALDRIGFKVQDRDRARGLFFVMYTEPDGRDSGMMAKLGAWFMSEERKSDTFMVSLVGGETVTRLLVLDGKGQRDQTGAADEIIAILHEELR